MRKAETIEKLYLDFDGFFASVMQQAMPNLRGNPRRLAQGRRAHRPACWADNRKVPQIVFKPDWNRHKNAEPFKRNDALLEALPIGLIAFPGSGIAQNLADKARKMGIPVWIFGEA
jgi:hypothetical protein